MTRPARPAQQAGAKKPILHVYTTCNVTRTWHRLLSYQSRFYLEKLFSQLGKGFLSVTRIAFQQVRSMFSAFCRSGKFFRKATRDARAVARLDTRSARTLGSRPRLCMVGVGYLGK